MGGYLAIERGELGGALFSVSLPKTWKSRVGKGREIGMTDKPIEVLIVEDDPRIAEINRRFTEKEEGFSVVGIARTGEEAVTWLEVVEPRLVLLDIYLPDMRGTELVRRIRGEGRDTGMILFSAL